MNATLAFVLAFFFMACIITVSSLNINYINRTIKDTSGELKNVGNFNKDLNVGALIISVFVTLIVAYMAYSYYSDSGQGKPTNLGAWIGGKASTRFGGVPGAPYGGGAVPAYTTPGASAPSYGGGGQFQAAQFQPTLASAGQQQ